MPVSAIVIRGFPVDNISRLRICHFYKTVRRPSFCSSVRVSKSNLCVHSMYEMRAIYTATTVTAHFVRNAFPLSSGFHDVCLGRLFAVNINQLQRVVQTIPIPVQRQWLVRRAQPRILLQKPPNRGVVPAHADLLQPARVRLVSITPRAVPRIDIRAAAHEVAKGVKHRRRLGRRTNAKSPRQVQYWLTPPRRNRFAPYTIGI